MHSFQIGSSTAWVRKVDSAHGMNLDIQIKFLILKSYGWWALQTETPELSRVVSSLSSEIINPKDSDQSINLVNCFFLLKILHIILQCMLLQIYEPWKNPQADAVNMETIINIIYSM